MRKTSKAILFLSGAAAMAVAPAAAQQFDASGTASLRGAYLFRYVTFFNDSAGNLKESCSLSGGIVFDGVSRYTLLYAQLFDSSVHRLVGGGSSEGSCTSLGGGTYCVQPNGIAQLDNPLFAATLFGTFSQPFSRQVPRRTTTTIYLSRFRRPPLRFRTAVSRELSR